MNALPDPATLTELAKQGGPVAGWTVAAFMFIVWRRSEQSHRRRDSQQTRNLEAFRDFAKTAIESADSPYGKRRQQDQKLAEALATLRADGVPQDKLQHLLADAIAQHANTGEP